MLRQLGAPELIIILGVVVLLVGGKKLPDLARGSGRALRIFKAETKGLVDGDTESEPAALASVESSTRTATEVIADSRQSEPTA